MAIQPASVWLKVMTSFRDVLSANAEFTETISKSALFGMFQSSETQSAAISAMIESAGYLGIAMYGVDVYQVSVDPLVEASDEFTAFIVAMVGSECRAFDIATVENYTRIFDEFGTYYVKRADLGGRAMGIWVARREALSLRRRQFVWPHLRCRRRRRGECHQRGIQQGAAIQCESRVWYRRSFG
jgi:hypothetical protein